MIPLWIPWTVAGTACVFALLHLDPQNRWGRDISRWAVAVIVLVVAVGMTLERRELTDEEFAEALDRVAVEIDGDPRLVRIDWVTLRMTDLLGHPVSAEEVVDPDDEEGVGPRLLQVEAGERQVGCLELTEPQRRYDAVGPQVTTVSVADEPCLDGDQ